MEELNKFADAVDVHNRAILASLPIQCQQDIGGRAVLHTKKVVELLLGLASIGEMKSAPQESRVYCGGLAGSVFLIGAACPFARFVEHCGDACGDGARNAEAVFVIDVDDSGECVTWHGFT